MDMTWTRKEKKRGLKTRDETWPENKEHEAKREKTLLQIFVAPSTPALPVEVVPEVFRRLRNRISGLSWNPGSVRQGLDISSFLAGTWSYLAMQECDPMDVQRLESLEYSVVFVAEAGLAVAMPEEFLNGRGQLVTSCCMDQPSGQWAMRAMFGRFELKAPEGWPLQHLVVGSAHLNNSVASEKPGRTRDLLQQLFTQATQSRCDILGVDLNQGLRQLSEQLRLFIQKNNLEPVATELLGCRDGDCCGWLIPPGSQFLKLTMQRHGYIPFDHRDLQIRMYDADSHYPTFVFHSIDNSRSRGAPSAARLERKDRKKQKLESKRTAAQKTQVRDLGR